MSQLWLSMNNAIIDAACISTQNECVKKKKEKIIKKNVLKNRLWTFLNRDRIVLERIERNRRIDFFSHPYFIWWHLVNFGETFWQKDQKRALKRLETTIKQIQGITYYCIQALHDHALIDKCQMAVGNTGIFI